MTSLIVFYTAYRHGIQALGIHGWKKLHVVTKDAIFYRLCGKRNYIKVNWVMLTGEDVEAKNATRVRKREKEDAES